MERRRHRRYRIDLPVELRVGRDSCVVRTADVSFEGLFLCTDAPPRLRQLVHLSLELPPIGAVFRSHAMCVFRLAPDRAQGRPPGAGCRLYATDEDARRHWQAFISRLRAAARNGGTDRWDASVAEAPAEPEVVERHPNTVEEMRVVEKELALGTVAVTLENPVEIGSALRAHVVHPETGGVFGLDGVTRSATPGPGGVEVVLGWRDPSDARLEEFRRFVDQGFTDPEFEDLAQVTLEAPR